MKRNIRNTILVAFGFLLGLCYAIRLGHHCLAGSGLPAIARPSPKPAIRSAASSSRTGSSTAASPSKAIPISEEFVETSDLNGKPYTVQYFERAVFEMHPENQPPNDVELSQLGTFLGKENYTQGFPTTAGQIPFYENQTDPVKALKSYYNAINRKEYERAYGYFNGAPNPAPSTAPPYSQFVQGYADTTFVTLAVGKVVSDAGAGQIYATFPAVVTATHTDNSTHVYSGCYTMHRVNSGISQDPNDVLWHINTAKLSEVPANSNVDQLLAQTCAP